MMIPRLAEHVIEVGAWPLDIHRSSVPLPAAISNLPAALGTLDLNSPRGSNFLLHDVSTHPTRTTNAG